MIRNNNVADSGAGVDKTTETFASISNKLPQSSTRSRLNNESLQWQMFASILRLYCAV